ncbi:FecR domain-containing protein [Mucilaginibacter sp. ZT4R22]|uniref:FecR domain-containing protein n=1 Tax=Mucilaginibacter pankratovii TaxID=2772110 RepID=A0ABR7WW74_9SPHI|nr:FecR domain-containing protein [Mucilaginibacter pankratovii]MBD1365522.1 FecR domain-containing protein [Mucilaginibacter pankratovii]
MSKSNGHMSDDLLVKYLVGEATPAETAEVDAWLAADEANVLHFNQLKRIWDESLQLANTSIVDEDAAYNRLQNRIKSMPEGGEAKVVDLQPKKTNWLAIAAAIVVICTTGYFALNYFTGPAATVTVASNDKVLIDTLADGSVVTMNKLSQLSYPEKFKGDTRAVTLQGEAFFNVTPDKTKPFIITVNDVTIRVVGTSFNIKSRNGKTEVIVATGIVNVSKDRNNINLNPGEKTEIDNSKGELSKQSVKGKLYSYYVNKELVCDQTPLGELVPALNVIYGANIVIGNKALEKMPITTVFKNQSLEQVLMVIEETFKISAERKNGQIILK